MLTNEQIQEARQLCDKANANFPGNTEKDELRNLLIISTLLPSALDEIERLRGVVEKLWAKYAKSRSIVVDKELLCSEIDCYNDNVIIACGSRECKRMFMDHYLGGWEE